MRDTHTEVRDPAAPLPPVDPPPADPATNPGREVDPPTQADDPDRTVAPSFSDGDADQETTARPAEEPTDWATDVDRPIDPAAPPSAEPGQYGEAAPDQEGETETAQYETPYEQAQYDRAPEYAEPESAEFDSTPTQTVTGPGDGADVPADATDDRFAEDRLLEERVAQDRDQRVDATDADQRVDDRSSFDMDGDTADRPGADFGAATPVATMGEETDRESFGQVSDDAGERNAFDARTVDGAPVIGAADDTPPMEVDGTVDRAPGDVPVTPLPELWPAADAESFRSRWRDLQLMFVDDPQAAARQADDLVRDAVETLTAALDAQRADLAGWQSENVTDTEQLRVAVQRYHTFLDNLLGG